MYEKLILGYSNITERIFLGKADKGVWKDEKRDITSNFIDVLLYYVPESRVREIKTPSTGKVNIFINTVKNKEDIEKTIRFLQKELEEIME